MKFDTAGKCRAVIVAAGRSSRMGGGISKQFLPLLGIPAIIWTLRAFDDARSIEQVVLVCRAEESEKMRDCVGRYEIRKVAAVVPGGNSRQESVFAGVRALPPGTGYVAVHDGARPLVMPEEIDACVRDAFRTGASALAVPLKNTVKRADSLGWVCSTPSRDGLWTVQTPQTFELSLYRKALAAAQAEEKDYTDDCQLIERLGAPVHLCRGNYENLKLTTSEDLALAEAILQKRNGNP